MNRHILQFGFLLALLCFFPCQNALSDAYKKQNVFMGQDAFQPTQYQPLEFRQLQVFPARALGGFWKVELDLPATIEFTHNIPKTLAKQGGSFGVLGLLLSGETFYLKREKPNLGAVLSMLPEERVTLYLTVVALSEPTFVVHRIIRRGTPGGIPEEE